MKPKPKIQQPLKTLQGRFAKQENMEIKPFRTDQIDMKPDKDEENDVNAKLDLYCEEKLEKWDSDDELFRF